MLKNKELHLIDVLSQNKVGKLLPTGNATVQPVALMRLGLFVPDIRRPAEKKGVVLGEIDATKELIGMNIAKSEGYTDIKIKAPRLSIETDFKVWVGVIRSFAKYGYDSNIIAMPYSEFASFCGYTNKEKRETLKEKIHHSLSRLTSTKIEMKTPGSSGFMSSLLQKARYNFDIDYVELQADPDLWELYQADRQVLLRLFVLRKLSSKGCAQALYTYLESLPNKPIPLSFERIRTRLNLTSTKAKQNQSIKAAIAALRDVGYLEGFTGKKLDEKETFLFIQKRDPACGGEVMDDEESEYLDVFDRE